MPIVQIDFAEGRSLDQKREMAVKVTKAVCDTMICPAEAVTIIMRELPRANFAKAGVLLSEKK
jgi:4-oxalocrotonate tautomerase